MALGVLVLSFSSLGMTDSQTRTCLLPPVSSVITKRFDPPACPYCAGHRTVDFAVSPGAAVRAPMSGTVTFAGSVAGSRYITIASSAANTVPSGEPGQESGSGSQGFLVTVGGAVSVTEAGVTPGETWVVAGQTVVAGQRIGFAAMEPIRLSLRRIVAGGPATYMDPEPALLGWKAPVRLVLEPGSRVASRTVTRTWACRWPSAGD